MKESVEKYQLEIIQYKKSLAPLIINVVIAGVLLYFFGVYWLANPDVNPATFHGNTNPDSNGVFTKFYCWANATDPELIPSGYQNFNIKYTESNTTTETWLFDNAEISASFN